MIQSTSLASGVLLLWKVLEKRGYDSHAVFRQAGLDPEKLFAPDARYPDQQIIQLWHFIIDATGIPVLDLKSPNSFTPLHCMRLVMPG